MKALSGRELEIIRHTAQGHTAKEIARMTGLDPRTIESYAVSIRRKLLAKNITHAVYLASRQHMLDE
jgi:LuxR family transcriptional regulator